MLSLLRNMLFFTMLAMSPSSVLADDKSVHDSLIKFNDTFNSYAEALDVEGLLSLYHVDTYWIAPESPPARGRDGVPRETVTFLSQNKGKLRHTVDDLFVSEDGTQAVMMGTTEAEVASKGFRLYGTYVFVLKREDENSPWKVIVDMFNNHGKN